MEKLSSVDPAGWTRQTRGDLRARLTETMLKVRQQAHDCFETLRDVLVVAANRSR
jgi:hypothetical protein